MAKIIADTTSCLPESIKDKFDIPVVPQMIHFGETSYTEGIDINTESFLQKLRSTKTLPKTSAPPPELFSILFSSHSNPAQPIFCIHPSTDLSGTVRSAETAKLDYPHLDIRVIDTRLVASPLGSVIHQAALWNQEGMQPAELEQGIVDLASRGKIYFVVATLDYLARGGRIGGASALLGNALQIKPILTLEDGKVEPLAKERTLKKTIEHLKGLVLDQYPKNQAGFLSIMHADNLTLANELAGFFVARLGIQQPVISFLPPAIITHAGPGSIAVGFFTQS